jgi:hypothetical protein
MGRGKFYGSGAPSSSLPFRNGIVEAGLVDPIFAIGSGNLAHQNCPYEPVNLSEAPYQHGSTHAKRAALSLGGQFTLGK